MGQPPAIGGRFGHYTVNGRLGAGGMGVVLDATDARLGRRVALKVISQDLADNAEFWLRFEREAQVLGRLDSPHVTKIYEYGEHDGARYIATQLIPGGDLRQLINKRGPLPPQLAARICAQVAEALRDAHVAGIVHRDVKPANVLIRDPDTAPYAYLCDFGIAATGSQGITASGAIAGTWNYLAPERVQGMPATPASDIYALGCLLWAALTGRPPYTGPDVDVALQHLNAPVPQLAGNTAIVRGINEVLATALAKDPTARYPAAQSLRADLLRVSELPADGFVAAAASRTGRRRTRHWLVAAGAALAVVAVTAVGWTWLSGGQGGQAAPPGSTPTSQPSGSGGAPEKKIGVTGDLDGDGYGDLSIRVGFGVDVSATTLTSDGSSFAARRAGKTLVGGEVRGDFDGDGVTDRAVVDWTDFTDTVTVSLSYGDGESTFLRSSMKSATEEFRPIAGDFDGDGKTDLGVVLYPIEAGAARVWVLRGTSDGFAEPEPWLRLHRDYRGDDSVLPGDFNGDGRHDLAVIDRVFMGERAQAFLAVSNGKRFTLSPGTRFTDNDHEKAAAVGDLDGDDRDELVLMSGTVTDEYVPRLLAERGGRLTVERDLQLSPALPAHSWEGDLAAGDFDGDGRDDLASVSSGRSSATVRVYRGVTEASAEGKVWATIPCRGDACSSLSATDTD